MESICRCKHCRSGKPFSRLRCEGGWKAWIAYAAIAAAYVGTTTYGNFKGVTAEKKAAEGATAAQLATSEKQIQATKDSEKMAQDTANAKLRAAQARKSQTILTEPGLEEANVNQKTALGV